MGDFITNDEYYVLAYGSPRLYIAPSYVGNEDIALAKRHASLQEAVEYAQPKAWLSMRGFAFVKVRVTTAPATTERKVTATRVVDLSKPVVIRCTEEGYIGADGYHSGNPLATARIFNDGSDAIFALRTNENKGCTFHLENVETITTPGKVTVTPIA